MLFVVKGIHLKSVPTLLDSIDPLRWVRCPPRDLLGHLVIIDTRFAYAADLGDLAVLLSRRGIRHLLVTDLPGDVGTGDLQALDPFNLVVFFDLDWSPRQYRLIREAARRAIHMLNYDDLWLLPKFLTLGYTEVKLKDEDIDDAVQVTLRRVERFTFCHRLAREAQRLEQCKRVIQCPVTLEARLPSICPDAVIQHPSSRNLAKILSVYYLDNVQMKDLIKDGHTERAPALSF